MLEFGHVFELTKKILGLFFFIKLTDPKIFQTF
jgi:hypothetical protein